MENLKSKKGRPKKYSYEGKKKICSIRLTDKEKQKILERFSSIQEFVQKSMEEVFN